MRNLLCIIFGFLPLTFAFGQTYSSLTSDEEMYAFLKWMTVHDRKHVDKPTWKRKHITTNILPWEIANFLLPESAGVNQREFINIDSRYLYKSRGGTDTLFNQQDRDFMFQQFTAMKDTVWQAKFSYLTHLTSKKQASLKTYCYSIPLFSVDKTYVIIQKHFHCGNMCIEGGYYVYRRLNDKHWEFVTAVNTWIS